MKWDYIKSSCHAEPQQPHSSHCQLELCCAVIFSSSMPGTVRWSVNGSCCCCCCWLSTSFWKQPQVNRLYCYPQLYMACKSGVPVRGQLSCLSGKVYEWWIWKQTKSSPSQGRKPECLGGHITCPLSRQSSLIEVSSIPVRKKLVALPELP